RSAEQLAAESPLAAEKTRTVAWRTLVESGSLAGELARATTNETEALRDEFRSFVTLGTDRRGES
ncbi:MAG TPA: hypothetical protein VHI99_30705, partial [Vicinamibacterales bacterium]|nr:hypothetical protein [Vicinamibacterales bacterium]